MRLLILGAGDSALLAAARARGLFVIAADRDPGAPGFRLADRRAIVSPEDETALERLAQAERVEAVIAPQAVAQAARLAERLRLRHPISAEAARLVASPLRRRERLRDAGVPQTRWAVLGRLGRDPGFCCDVGPPDRRGLRVAEEATGAAEVTVTAFLERGRFRSLLGAGPAAALAERAAAALGIEAGLTSTRLRLGVDGPRVADLCTYPSSREVELCRLLYGIDLRALVLDAAFAGCAAVEDVRLGTAHAQVA